MASSSNITQVLETGSKKMSVGDYDEIYKFSCDLVKRVGAEIVAASRVREKLYETKSSAIDFVTETDGRVEKLLMDAIAKRYPDHVLIGEESAVEGKHQELTDAPTWIVDPIDGTMNFVHSFPCSAISLALWANKTAEVGLVYNPTENKLYSARRGGGAFLNGDPIHVSGTKELSQALVMFEVGTSRDPAKLRCVASNFAALHPRIHGFRSLGSAALDMCMVAQGGADAYYEYGLHSWDMAAGVLIVREAGGYVCDTTGADFDLLSRRVLCAANSELASQMSPMLAHVDLPRD
ncbi:unnamed protein product [Notodromas monacha]|uniref:Inositol-1-monophosphatase n=1 Tax=Notodromas monacha TaxID=399045 RepID=A0A7R9BVM7_9CRUS|nr:unnamed protein product [Notodromas monacha]CAG0921072.1 unnamed protein product [Notodromas monacha]